MSRTKKVKCKVYLNIYDMVAENRYGYPVGLGVFHSGVEVLGREYSYGFHEHEGTGVFVVEPKGAEGVWFRESLLIGEIYNTPLEIRSSLDVIAREFPGRGYHVIYRNCNHFADELCRRLTTNGAPYFINRLAYLGSLVHCFLPAYLQNSPADPENRQQLISEVQSFPGDGHVLGADDVGMTELPNASVEDDETEDQHLIAKGQRERLADAAMKRLHPSSSS
eukprot:TRINITY_DN5758_c0_g1_i1.p1 TRINITY_DN5758_c0_g1~~TRINITY_DN5758_c0_g1_i1.p1  ORF type:complete len:222 (+),score=19.99 TRINITY_DN5758_c0_g1_i1:187-852(+)